jgi:hypothetical protein
MEFVTKLLGRAILRHYADHPFFTTKNYLELVQKSVLKSVINGFEEAVPGELLIFQLYQTVGPCRFHRRILPSVGMKEVFYLLFHHINGVE